MLFSGFMSTDLHCKRVFHAAAFENTIDQIFTDAARSLWRATDRNRQPSMHSRATKANIQCGRYLFTKRNGSLGVQCSETVNIALMQTQKVG